MTAPAGAGPGETVYRVVWVPGTDLLLAVCHCGAEREFDDPVALWQWLLAHPEGHRGDVGPASAPAAGHVPALERV